jgi:hypothetical protein
MQLNLKKFFLDERGGGAPPYLKKFLPRQKMKKGKRKEMNKRNFLATMHDFLLHVIFLLIFYDGLFNNS